MAKPKQMPREKGIDHSIDLLRRAINSSPIGGKVSNRIFS